MGSQRASGWAVRPKVPFARDGEAVDHAADQPRLRHDHELEIRCVGQRVLRPLSLQAGSQAVARHGQAGQGAAFGRAPDDEIKPIEPVPIAHAPDITPPVEQAMKTGAMPNSGQFVGAPPPRMLPPSRQGADGKPVPGSPVHKAASLEARAPRRRPRRPAGANGRRRGGIGPWRQMRPSGRAGRLEGRVLYSNRPSFNSQRASVPRNASFSFA